MWFFQYGQLRKAKKCCTSTEECCYDLQFINFHTAGQQQSQPLWIGTECHIAGLESNITFVNKATAHKVSRWMKCTQHLSKKKHGKLQTNGRKPLSPTVNHWHQQMVGGTCISNLLASTEMWHDCTKIPVQPFASNEWRTTHQFTSKGIPKDPGAKHTSATPKKSVWVPSLQE